MTNMDQGFVLIYVTWFGKTRCDILNSENWECHCSGYIISKFKGITQSDALISKGSHYLGSKTRTMRYQEEIQIPKFISLNARVILDVVIKYMLLCWDVVRDVVRDVSTLDKIVVLGPMTCYCLFMVLSHSVSCQLRSV